MNKKILDDINTFLLEHWDPIGICGETGAHNEYFLYVENTFIIITKTNNYKALYSYLREVETQNMGLEGDQNITKAAAKNLFEKFKPVIKNQS